MSIIGYIKALWQNREAVKQAHQIAKDLPQIKRGWKTPAFWATMLGNLISLVGAFKGVLDPKTSLVIMTALTTVYNVIRGLKKSDEAASRTMWRSTEFWMGVGTQVSGGLLAFQQAGIEGPWLSASAAIVAGAMAGAQKYGASTPEPK